MSRYKWSLRHIRAGLWVLPWCLLGPAVAGSGVDAIDRASISGILIDVADQNLGQFGFKLSSSLIAERVGKNLAEWQYPVKSSRGDSSHTLLISLGKAATGDTPVGFSWASGDSDPRGLGFQQARVLPISCHLKKIGGDEASIENKATVSAHQLIDESNQTKVTDKVIDHVSTVCFELLDELKLPATGNRMDTHTFKPGWMPDVQVEVKQVPALAKPEDPSSTRVEEVGGETKKQIIIHNQGSPVILEFGYERK